MTDSLHLVRIPLRADSLAAVARRRGLPLRNLDDGYVSHCVLRELWQDDAPSPFVLYGGGRSLHVFGYCRANAQRLLALAQKVEDRVPLAAITDLDAIESKAIPRFAAGRRLGFHLRACPVVRLAKPKGGHRAGAEVDAFLARCFTVGKDTAVSREEVYREWLEGRFGDGESTGATLAQVRIAAIARERLVRRSQGEQRKATELERPDVRFEGELVVTDGDRFADCLARGIGRHRAFGFGALMLVPVGTSYPR